MNKHSPSPKIEVQGEGIGIRSQDDIERRAHEIALIADRSRVTDEDRRQAEAELAGQDLPATINEDADSTQSLSRDPSDPAVERGHQTPDYVDADEKEVVERLALEGVEEAQHDQMVQSRNTDIEAPSNPSRRRR